MERDKEELIAGVRPSAEALAKGTDKIALQYSANVFVGGDCKLTALSATLSWDEIFAAVAPVLMGSVAETRFRTVLEERLAQQALQDAQTVIPRAPAVRNVVLGGNVFNQIKIQLRALGYIRRLPGDESTEARWQLTPQGDAAMTQLLTKKRR